MCKDRLKYLKLCVGGFEKQTDKNFKLIVVDNGSTDGTLEWLKEKSIEYYKQDFFISHCRNLAIEKCTTPHILFIDSDVVVLSSYIAVLNSLLEKYKESVLYTKRIFINFEDLINYKDYSSDDVVVSRFFDSEDAGTHSCLFDVELLKKVGCFSEEFNTPTRFRGEDWDLLNRLYLLGVPFYNVENLFSLHIEHERENIDLGEDFYRELKNNGRILASHIKGEL